MSKRGDAKVPYPIRGGCQTITTSGTSARTSNGVTAQTRTVLITATAGAHYVFGDSSIVATTTDTYIHDNETHHVRIAPGQYVAAIQAATGGSVFVSELDT